MSAPDSRAARNAARPVRPKPLMATRTAMTPPPVDFDATLGAPAPSAIGGSGAPCCGFPPSRFGGDAHGLTRARADTCPMASVLGALWRGLRPPLPAQRA